MNPETADELNSPEEINALVEGLGVAESRASYAGSGDFQPQGFKQLRVWQVAMDLMALIYKVSASFPESERYGLTRQIRSAAVSVTLNIAEGWGRNSKAELARFSDIARGSLNEVDSALEAVVRLEFGTRAEFEQCWRLIGQTGMMLLRLSKALRAK